MMNLVGTCEQDTEDFFFEVECARDSLQRMHIEEYPHENPQVNTYARRHVYREYQRLTREYPLNQFNRIKQKIRLLTPNGRLCSVPMEVQAHLKDIRDTEERLTEEYWDHWNLRREPGQMLIWNHNKKPRKSGQ